MRHAPRCRQGCAPTLTCLSLVRELDARAGFILEFAHQGGAARWRIDLICQGRPASHPTQLFTTLLLYSASFTASITASLAASLIASVAASSLLLWSHVFDALCVTVQLAGIDRRERCNECRPIPTRSSQGVGTGSSLSLVLSALTTGKTAYVPYRDSPTTELMQEMLGGRSRSSWLAHVIPGPEGDYDETTSTLVTTARAGSIMNNPTRLPHGLAAAEAATEAREVEELHRMLTSGPSSRRAGATGSPSGPSLAQNSLAQSSLAQNSRRAAAVSRHQMTTDLD